MSTSLLTRVALLVDVTCVSRSPWWSTALASLNEKYIQVTSVWAETQDVAEEVNKVLLSNMATVYWGLQVAKSKRKTGKLLNSNTLEALAAPSSDVDALIVDLPASKHLNVLKMLFSLPQFNKHLFSLSIPVLDPDRLSALLKQHTRLLQTTLSTTKPSIWGIENPMRFESAVQTACDMLPDLGTLVGGSLLGSQLPCMTLNRENEHDVVEEVAATYSALLRKIFGELDSVSSVKWKSNPQDPMSPSSICGSAKFLSGTICSINISSKEAPYMDFWIWGTLGRVSILWDATKQYFVVQRYLKHFEHPSLHNAMGASACLAAWIESIQYGTPHPSSFHPLVDLTVANALCTSEGAVVAFKAVPVAAPRITSP